MTDSMQRRQGGPPDGTPGSSSDSSSGSVSTGQTVTIIVIVAICILTTAAIASYVYLRRQRAAGRMPRFLPAFLKTRLERWHPVKKYSSVNLTERGDSTTEQNTEYRPRATDPASQPTTAAAGVDRNASIRSVMTLPPYSQAPKETEQVIGREGERAGMDTVVEFPETAEEEEAVRDAEMESLYQIRQARRREIAEREERRRERRAARERGDWARLEQLRQESRQRQQGTSGSTGNLTADTLIVEHNSRPKERRVSSVAYADVGQVRHDGTRLRANSHESESGGLLDGAAPMGEGNHGRSASDATSLLTLDNLSRPSLPYAHGRHRSDSGALSISTVSSFDVPQPTPGTTDEASHPNSDESEHQRSASTSEESPDARRLTPPGSDAEHDIARPPDYEQHDWGEAPAYTEEELRRRESQRSARLAVPAINVEGPSEPTSPNLSRVSEEHTR